LITSFSTLSSRRLRLSLQELSSWLPLDITAFHAVRDLPVALLGITCRIASANFEIVGSEEGGEEETDADDLRRV
jgi:hypothetical protein